MNLQLFDEGGGAGTSGADAAGSADSGAVGAAGATGATGATGAGKGKGGKPDLSNVRYGKAAAGEEAADEAKAPERAPETVVTADVAQAKRAEFERMIRGEYKDLFTERTQQMIDARFKQTKGLEERAQALEPLLDMLAGKYGVDARDAQALVKAIEEDSGYYEQEALDKGLTIEQLKYIKQMERENASFKRMAEERERKTNADRIYAKWHNEAEACKQVYDGFDLAGECQHPETGQRFMDLLRNGIDVRTAYEVIHKDDIIGGAMHYTAQQVQQKVVNDIRARGARPAENGASASSTAVLRKADVSRLTRADREEIARRVMRGERIEF